MRSMLILVNEHLLRRHYIHNIFRDGNVGKYDEPPADAQLMHFIGITPGQALYLFHCAWRWR